jgi:uncharacterized protein (DUF2141 family)
MKKIGIGLATIIMGLILLSSYTKREIKTHSLRVAVTGLRNSTGNVQFSLYNKDGSIPDEKYKKYYLQKTAKIKNGHAQVEFIDIPEGRYAVNVLHDENKDGKIEKGWILPVEGIGFSNYVKIGLTNRPNFTDASFMLKADAYKKIKIIYM